MSAVVIRPVFTSLQKMIDSPGGRRAADVLQAAAANLAGLEDRLAGELDGVLEGLRSLIDGPGRGRPDPAAFAEIRRLVEHALSLCGPLGQTDLAAAIQMLGVQADTLSETDWWPERALGPALDLVCLRRAGALPEGAFGRLMEQLQLCQKRYREQASRRARSEETSDAVAGAEAGLRRDGR